MAIEVDRGTPTTAESSLLPDGCSGDCQIGAQISRDGIAEDRAGYFNGALVAAEPLSARCREVFSARPR